MKIRVLLYKARRDGKVVDNVIAIWTMVINVWRLAVCRGLTFKEVWQTLTSWYSHTEVWAPEDRSGFETTALIAKKINKIESVIKYHGNCYTSTMGQIRSKSTIIQTGTCKRPASRVLKHPERWDYVEIDLMDYDYRDMMQYLDGEVAANAGYAKRDILKFVGLGLFPDKIRNICSEIIHNALIEGDVLPGKHAVVSPLMLALLLKKHAHVVKKLQ